MSQLYPQFGATVPGTNLNLPVPSTAPAPTVTNISVTHNPDSNASLQGGAAGAVPGVAPANLPQLGPTVPAAPSAAPQPAPAPVPQVQAAGSSIAPATIPPATGQGFSFMNGQGFDANGNPVAAPTTPAIDTSLGTNAGLAGLSPNDFLTSIGSTTAVNKDEYTKILNDLGIPATAAAAYAPPAQSTVDVYQQGYDQAGMAGVKSQILGLNDQITQARQDLTTAMNKENENPFLSEASRTGRLQTLQLDGNNQINNLVSQQGQLQNVYANGINELNNLVTRHTNDFTTNQQTNQAKLTYLLGQSEKQAGFVQNEKIARYVPSYLQGKAQGITPPAINTPNGGSFYYDKTQGKYVELTPPVSRYDQVTSPLGLTGTFDKQTGVTTWQDGTTSGAPVGSQTSSTYQNLSPGSVQIPPNPQANGQPQLASQNNNPGNLMYAGQPGATQGAGGFAKFATPEAGYQALVGQVQLDASRGETLGQYITKYAPPSSNNTAQYIQQASTALGVSANTPLASIDPNKVATFQAKKESSTVITASAQTSSQGTPALTVQNQPQGGNQTIIPPLVAQYVESLPNVPNSQYINADRVSAVQQNVVKSIAAGAKIPVLTGSEVFGLKSVDVIFKNLSQLSILSQELLSPGIAGRIKGFTLNQVQNATQNDPRFAKFQLARDTAIKSVQALAGGAGSGLRLNMGEISIASDNLPQITDSLEYAQTKISGLQTLLTNQLSETFPNINQASSPGSSDIASLRQQYGY